MTTLTKLAELTIGDDERAESSETVECFISMLLCGLLSNWRTWQRCISTIDVLRSPDEILKEIAFVLGEEKMLCLLHYIPEISD